MAEAIYIIMRHGVRPSLSTPNMIHRSFILVDLIRLARLIRLAGPTPGQMPGPTPGLMPGLMPGPMSRPTVQPILGRLVLNRQRALRICRRKSTNYVQAL